MSLLIKAKARINKSIAIVRGCAKASIKGIHMILHHLNTARSFTSGLTFGLTPMRSYLSESMWRMERVVEKVFFGTPVTVPQINHTLINHRVNQSRQNPLS